MAAEQQQQLVAPFPAPPPFWQHFTAPNRHRLRQLRKDAAASSSPDHDAATSTPDIDILALPAELRYLIPPPPPSTTKFTVFGQEIDLDAPEPSLAEAGIEQLYPSDDPSVKTNPQPHLIALARSLLTTFLGLTGVLAANPELYEERVADLQAIVFNMHSLINQYRPHQARESLIMLMEDRVERLRAEIRGIDEGRERVEKLLEGMRGNALAVQGPADGADDAAVVNVERDAEEDVAREKRVDEKRVERQKSTWAMLETEMG